MNNKVYNFSAGPSQMPNDVLVKINKELFNINNTNISILEMSHRSNDFIEILTETEKRFRKILNINNDYAILFMQGGASLQFSLVPMNITNQTDYVAYIDSGIFSSKAIDEARKICNVDVVSSSKDKKYSYIPYIKSLDSKYKYLHITHNNTICGTSFNSNIEHGNTLLIADMSSSLLTKRINIADYDLIYAGAQKNISVAGLTIVIINKELLEKINKPNIPNVLNYKNVSEASSMYNTPPTFAIYVASLMFKWIEENGGIEQFEKNNIEKSSLLYSYIDNDDFYVNNIKKEDRSITNVVFNINNEQLSEKFLKEAFENGIINIKGHRTVGGFRASMYNAMPLDGVKYLISFMDKFKKENQNV